MTSEGRCAALSISSDLELYHVGPPLDSGPLPALFYFSLSGPDSLCKDPYNQPVEFLSSHQIRIFSLTLPAHEHPLSPLKALNTWAEEMARGEDPLGLFLDNAERALEFCIHQKLVYPDKLGAAGLSRGALLAALLAARRPNIQTVLGFAPLTQLNLAKEFLLHSPPSALRYDVARYKEALASKRIRFYIGNRDTRVNTRACFECIETLVEEAYQQQIRSPRIELFISPSIGHQGHGTLPEIFRDGAEWIASNL